LGKVTGYRLSAISYQSLAIGLPSSQSNFLNFLGTSFPTSDSRLPTHLAVWP